MSFEYSLIYFISGALIYKFLSSLFGIFHGIKSYQAIEKYAVVFSVTIDKVISAVIESSIQELRKKDVNSEEIEDLIKAQQTMIEIFRKSILVIMHSSKPLSFQRTPAYKSWKELETYANKYTREKPRGPSLS